MTKVDERSAVQSVSAFLLRNRALILLLFFFFLLRIPTLLEPHRYADEEIYLTLGQGMRNGLVFYRDIHDNKPPFLYVLAGFTRSLFWFRMALLFFHAAGVIFFWRLAMLVYNRRRFPVLVSTAFFGFLSTLPFLEGNIANGENFMIVPAILGAFLFYRIMQPSSYPQRLWIYPAIGLLFSAGFLFKIPIVFDFLGLLTFWWLLADPNRSFSQRLKFLFSRRLWLVVGGFLLPIVFSVAYYAWNGAFEPYVRSALLQNIGYVSTWRGEGGGALANPLVWRGLVIGVIVLGTLAASRSLSFAMRFTIVWVAFSLYGALLSSRPYPHYLLEPLVPFSLLIVLVFSQSGIRNRLVGLGMIGIVALAYFENGFWYYKTVPYYTNFFRYARGSYDWEAYIRFWGVERNYQIADYLRQRTLPEDRIFVWGTEPSIYALSDRLPVGRYTVSYHIFDFDAFEETMVALNSTSPKFIVVTEDLDRFSELKFFLQDGYSLDAHIDGADIYRKIQPSSGSFSTTHVWV